MRLLHVINSANPADGGPIEAIRQSLPVLQDLGHQTEIACLDPPQSPWLHQFPAEVHAFGPGETWYRYSRSFVKWLSRRASSFDCAIVHGLWLHTSLGVRHALRGSKTPYFIYAHGLLDPCFRRLFPLKHLKKYVVWLLWEHRVVRDAAAVLFTCEQERELAATSFRPYRCRSAIVPYCVGEPPNGPKDQSEFFFSHYPTLRGKRLVLFLSRIHRKKGCDALVEAFSRVASVDPDLHLVMAGPGDPPSWLDELKQRACRLGLDDRITWTGMLSGHLKWSAFRAAEVFVLPTHQENFGIAIVESLGCGTPALITDRVNIWRELDADGAAIVGEPGVDGALRLLRQWLGLDVAARRMMRERSLDCFNKRFDSRRAAVNLVETLQRHGVSVR